MKNDAVHDWFNLLVDELGWMQIIEILKATAFWGVLGICLGFALSFAAYRGFQHLRWYRAKPGYGRTAQRAMVVIIALVCMVLFATAGVLEGIRWHARTALTHSRIGTHVLPVVADWLADGLAWIDWKTENTSSLSEPEIDKRLAEFRAGSSEIDVQALLRRVDSLQDVVLKELTMNFEQYLLKKAPNLRGGLVEKLLHDAIQHAGPLLLEKKILDETHRAGVDHIYSAVRTRLLAEAALTGNPTSIARRELSGFLLREGIIPSIVTPVRSIARQQQIICVLLAVFMCLAPAVISRACQKKPVLHPTNNLDQ